MSFYCPSAQCPFWSHNSDLEHPIVTLETFLYMPCWYLWSNMDKITQKKACFKKVLSCFNCSELGVYTVVCN